MQTSPSALKILPIRASVRTREQRADQQYHDADANRSIGKIEDQKWAPFADMQVQEIEHEAKPDAIEDIATSADKQQPQSRRKEQKSGEEGTSGAARVALSGRRSIKKRQKHRYQSIHT